ncbi:conserved exported protein of unknown function [Pseudomonas marincola]|jgi:hypothetical protein|uniref:DUF2780 domain-containing protein n=1 Tax=Pseudomonas marincola TaxID=437900 RepID=A0A1I6XUD0_9PSED|nr:MULTISPECIES: DUF2780 domain-containing protein [Pseudomonas]OEO26402.1 hypothetical protein AX279_06165 [Pseudomonas sp. J237]CAE6928268.1 conserved exported protein of unknown function [Pseudomonas marincola]SFT41632.1 Protein of unknown function VcgC/VcgE [Pseudomonas marincola]
MFKPSKALLISLTLAASPAFAFTLDDATNAASGVASGMGGSAASAPMTGQTGDLLSALSGQLGVTPNQAAGGTGALLGLAKNKLDPSQFSELSKAIPGLDQFTGNSELMGQAGSLLGKATGSQSGLGSMMGNANSMADVSKTFSALGMNSDMINQFAPALLDYFGKQGLSAPLLQSLGSIWGV